MSPTDEPSREVPHLLGRLWSFVVVRARWALMVPLHLVAFAVLYVAAFQMMEAGFVETSTETARQALGQAVDGLAVGPRARADGRHVFDSFLAAHRSVDLRLFAMDGSPLGTGHGGAPPAMIEELLKTDDGARFWIAARGPESLLHGVGLVRASDRCSPCHEIGEALGAAALQLDVGESLAGIRRRLRINLGLLIAFWAAVLGGTTALVRGTVHRSTSRLEAALAAAEAGEDQAARTAGSLVLDPGSAALHKSLSRFLERQRRHEAEVASRLAHTDQLASLGRLAAGLAHEIKNPLAGIQGALEILREDTSDETTRQLCGEMLDELGRVNETLQALLTSARPSPPRLAVARVEDLLADVHRLQEPGLRRRKIALEVELEDPSLEARVDAGQIHQVLLNLVNNAADAIDENGTIRLRAGPFPDGAGVILAVQDDGPGISEDVLKKIFQPFFTTKFSGTGLGLAIARSLVEQHGGTLEVESEPGRGTTFYVLLPDSLPESESAEP